VADQAIHSDTATEAAAGFEDMLKHAAADDPSDAFFARDWSSLWQEISASGWTAIADSGPDGEPGEDSLSLLDLTLFAEVWGHYLVPLPFVPTLAVRYGQGPVADPSARLSYAVAEGGVALVPFGSAVDQVLCGKQLTSRSALTGPEAVDDWAESVPLGEFALGPDLQPAGQADHAAILAAAEAIGAAAETLARSVAYAKVREQFGKPIGSNQAIAHHLADMHCRLEQARAAVVMACAEPSERAAAVALIFAECLRVAEGAVQVHGGIGFTWEATPHRYYRHVMALRRVAVAAAPATTESEASVA
jgi:hypothetical protein